MGFFFFIIFLFLKNIKCLNFLVFLDWMLFVGCVEIKE